MNDNDLSDVQPPDAYWWAVAVGWIGLGFALDVAGPWVVGAATLAFGAAHAAIAGRALSHHQRVRTAAGGTVVVHSSVPVTVFPCLGGLAGMTAVIGILFSADGARHPVTIAGLVVAVAVLGGGRSVVAAVARRDRARARAHYGGPTPDQEP